MNLQFIELNKLISLFARAAMGAKQRTQIDDVDSGKILHPWLANEPSFIENTSSVRVEKDTIPLYRGDRAVSSLRK